MKRFAFVIIAILLLALGALPFMANAQSAATWIPTTTYLKPFKSTLGIRVPALASAGSCLTTDADGDFVTASCSGGSGVTSVAMTVPTGLTVAGSPITTTGTLAVSLTSGYNIPLTASTTAWNNFLKTPSTIITAGTGIDWSGNTLNGVYTAGDGLTLTGEDFDFDGGATPSGDLGGTWASPSVTDDSHAHTGTTLSGIDISSDTNLAGDTEIVLTGDALSIASTITRDTELHSAVTLSGALDYITLVGQDIVRGAIDLATDLTGVLGIANGGLGAAFTDPNADQLMFWDDSAAKITGIASMVGAAISGTTLTINDVTCTDCLSSTEIGDEYLFNNGDVGTGVYDFGGATSLELVNGSAPTVDATGECALDTTSGQFKCYDGAVAEVYGNGHFYPAATIMSTTSAFTGTTTWPLGTAFVGETWNKVQCFTDVGTAWVRFGDGTNYTNQMSASTTVGTFTFTSNNTFTAAEKRYIQIGTPASSPTKVSCTVDKQLTAD